jgi:hypothetical protein
MEVIGAYDFTIVHRAGRSHGNADGLSRRACKQCGREEDKDPTEKPAEAPEEVPGKTPEIHVRAIGLAPHITRESLREAQLADPDIGGVLRAREEGGPQPGWKEVAPTSNQAKYYFAQWDQLEVRDGILKRRWESGDGSEIRWQIVLPRTQRALVLEELHGSKTAGHLGITKTLGKVQRRYYWVGITSDVRSWIRKCIPCAKRKTPPRKRRARLQQYRVGAPVDRVAIDVLGPFPETERGNKYVLVLGDYFTKWMEAYAIPNQEAGTVADKVVKEFCCRFGTPRELHSDQGRNFESELISQVCELLGIHKTRTTPYMPKSDGMVERFNRTLVDIVAIMIEPTKNQEDWDLQVDFATLAYRCSPQESTGETPNMMMLGREIALPLDLMTEPPEDEKELRDYAEDLRERMRIAHDRARKKLQVEGMRRKKHYDGRATGSEVKEGDFVWLHNPAKKVGLSPKLMCRWEGPYLVIKRLSSVVFRIQRGPRMKSSHTNSQPRFANRYVPPWVIMGAD